MAAILGYLVIGALFGAINVAIARAKHRNPSPWFWGGFFFGIIALIVVLCVPSKAVVAAAGTVKTCPYCVSEIPISATVCRFCQRDLSEITALPSTSADAGRL
jgi:hypothetical protein